MSAGCRECGGELVEGFLLEHAHAQDAETRWVEGKLETGIPGAKLEGRFTADVVAYRCTACGTLKLVAR